MSGTNEKMDGDLPQYVTTQRNMAQREGWMASWSQVMRSMRICLASLALGDDLGVGLSARP